MPVKMGNGGHGNENYDPETGKYVGTDKGNFSDSDKKILNSMGLDGENFYDSLSEEEKAKVDNWYNDLRPGDKEINSIDDLEEIKDDGGEADKKEEPLWENKNGSSISSPSGGISDLNIGNRERAVLNNAGIKSIDDLMKMSDDDLLNLKNMGRKSFKNIKKALEEYNGKEEKPISHEEEKAKFLETHKNKIDKIKSQNEYSAYKRGINKRLQNFEAANYTNEMINDIINDEISKLEKMRNDPGVNQHYVEAKINYLKNKLK